jgi:hypothetical protein
VVGDTCSTHEGGEKCSQGFGWEVVHLAHMREGKSVHRVLVGRPKGKRPLGRPRCRWEHSIKMDLRQTEMDGANWIQLARHRVQ